MTYFDPQEFRDAVLALGFGPPSAVGRLIGMKLIESGDDPATAAAQVVSDGLALSLFPVSRKDFVLMCARDASCGSTWFRGVDSAATRAIRDRRVLLGRLEQAIQALIRLKECFALMERAAPQALRQVSWSADDALMLERALGDFEPSSFTPDYPSPEEVDAVDNSRD